MRSNLRDPVIVGVCETCQQVPDNLEAAKSLVDLLEETVANACADTGAAEKVISGIDTMVMVRTFADTTTMHANPFGTVSNYPRAIARRIGAKPQQAVYGTAGGDSPQALVAEFAGKITSGDAELVVLMGGEALATTKAGIKSQLVLDWSDETGGQLEDRGLGLQGIVTQDQIDNGMVSAPILYGLLENARRSKLGLSREQYAKEMASLFSRFSEVAAGHRASMFPESFSAEQILEVSERNPMIADPYTKRLVAKDGVNQAAAVVMASREKAEELGIFPEKMVFPLTCSTVREHALVQRTELSESEAMRLAYEQALEIVGISAAEISCMDIYSCFPIAVFAACDALGIPVDDPRGLTLTGGLPFFGGAGNNYAMHSIVNVVENLRRFGLGYGLVGANGGVLSKHSIGIYSTAAHDGWHACDNQALQSQVDQQVRLEVEAFPQGEAKIETFTVGFHRGQPNRGYIVGRTRQGKRFLATTDSEDAETTHAMLDDDPLGKSVSVRQVGPGNHFTFLNV